MEKQLEYSSVEKKILSILYSAGKPLPTERIAKQLDISRITAKKYLLGLEKNGKVSSKKEGRAVYWWLSLSK
ncbi:MAG: HTH domain-containing protein [Candidatus Parvarchaeum sp.]